MWFGRGLVAAARRDRLADAFRSSTRSLDDAAYRFHPHILSVLSRQLLLISTHGLAVEWHNSYLLCRLSTISPRVLLPLLLRVSLLVFKLSSTLPHPTALRLDA